MSTKNPKKIADLPQSVLECLACHMIFQAAKVPNDDVLAIPKNGRIEMAAFRKDGKGLRTFVYDAGSIGIDGPKGEGLTLSEREAAFADIWPKAFDLWNAAPPEERIAAYKTTKTRDKATEIWAAMYGMGFKIPDGLL